jgi:hypothetical protein
MTCVDAIFAIPAFACRASSFSDHEGCLRPSLGDDKIVILTRCQTQSITSRFSPDAAACFIPADAP